MFAVWSLWIAAGGSGASSPEAASGGRLCAAVAGLLGDQGSVLRCASSGAAAGAARTRGPVDVAGICPPLPQRPERRLRRRSGRGGLPAPDDAFVPVKSEVQSDLQWQHRLRERLIAERTALINLPPRAGAGTRGRAARRRDPQACLLERRRVIREHDVGADPWTGVIAYLSLVVWSPRVASHRRQRALDDDRLPLGTGARSTAA
jgi:hypothetical protein